MKHLVRLAGVVLCTLGLHAFAHDRVGANLNFIADFFRNHEFNDLVKQSRQFLKAGSHFNDGDAADRATLGADGWPTEDFKLFSMTAQGGVTGLGGTYKLVFTGQATLVATGATIQNKVFDAGTNTTRADVVFPAGGDTLFIDFTGTGGVVKDVRLLRPGVAEVGAAPFTATWLAHVNRFNVVRFLDWTRTNGNRHVAWADRTTPQKHRTETLITQWETVIAAANALGRDAWINVPVQANDEYVTNLATLFRDTLNPGLNVYVEYGNELWNFGIRDVGLDEFNGGAPFNGATVNRDLANAGGAEPSLSTALAGDGPPDATGKGFRRVALRLRQISDIFKTVWGAGAINTRVRPVLAGQMANPFIVTEGLRYVDEILDVRPGTVFYALSGAPYIFPAAVPDGSADETPGMTVDQIVNGLAAGVANAPNDNAYQYLNHAGLGAWYGLKVVGYEAGFDNFGPQNIANKRLANLDPRIKQVCKDFLDGWHAFGFDHVLWFNAGAQDYNTQFGMWPLVEDMAIPNVPKNQCIDETLAAALPALTAGTSIASPIAGGNFRGSGSPAGPVTGGAGPFGFPGYVEYLVRADTAGSYNLVFTGSAPAGEGVRVELNNALVSANVSLPTSSGPSSAVPVTLRKGLNALRLKRVGGSWSITSFTFTFVSGGLAVTPVSFTPNSINTTSFPNVVTVTNQHSAVVTISSITVSGDFELQHACTTINPGQTCQAGLFFRPTGEGVRNGTITVASDAPGSPHTAAVTGTGERSLVTHYYRAILNRAPDAPGKAFWDGESARLTGLGVNINEVWFVMAGFFFNSPEYLSANKNDAQFVADLYNTFFNRAPDPGGQNFWTGQIAGGLPREVVLFSFMFSPEFRAFAEDIFGNTAARPEVDMVVDFFRGILNRLPDTGSFQFWLAKLRTAQCAGAGPVFTAVDEISAAFIFNPEYNNRGRNNTQFVTDMFYSFLRRGGDIGGVQFWVNELNTNARDINNVRINFLNSPEFGARVQAVINAGCLP